MDLYLKKLQDLINNKDSHARGDLTTSWIDFKELKTAIEIFSSDRNTNLPTYNSSTNDTYTGKIRCTSHSNIDFTNHKLSYSYLRDKIDNLRKLGCSVKSDYDKCGCVGRTPCSCNAQQVANCGSRTACVCNTQAQVDCGSRTTCSCNTDNFSSTCICNGEAICLTRTASDVCSRDRRCPTRSDCVSRTACWCNTENYFQYEACSSRIACRCNTRTYLGPDCLSRTVTWGIPGDKGYCESRTACSCNARGAPLIDCGSRIACSCNSVCGARTTCSCNTETDVVMGCKGDVICSSRVGVTCETRTTCLCNVRETYQEVCSSRTPCSCNAQQVANCGSRTACVCNTQAQVDCGSRTTCNCNARCFCNTVTEY